MGSKQGGVVAAGHPQTAEAGRLILEAGGNAFDAAIASVLAACVVESSLTSLGGGGFLLARTAAGKSYLFDFFCQTPLHNPGLGAVDFYPVDLNFGGALQTFHIGRGSVAVPGMVAGIFAVHERLGSLPLSVLMEPALHYARQGFTVNDFNQFAYQLLEPILTMQPEAAAFYAPQGSLLAQGDRARLPQFAEVLELLAREGPDCFYRGELARLALETLGDGTALTAEDWAQYQVAIRQPLAINYRQYQFITNPPPSAGGILIALALKLLESFDLGDYPLGSVPQIQLLSQVMATVNQARQEELDGLLHQTGIAQQFLAGDRQRLYQQLLGQRLNKLGSTTHLSVLDGEGNSASLTSSNGEGSGQMIPGTGVMLNNMLGEADLNPHGFYQWAPGQRLTSMMAPSLVLTGEHPLLVLGSGGSNRIRSAILQVVCNCLDYGLPLTTAVRRGRIHWEDHHLAVEPFLDPQLLPQLQFQDGTQTKLWTEGNMFFGGVHAVGYDRQGQMVGAADPRRSGAVAYAS